MKIKQIRASAGRNLALPGSWYQSARPWVELIADVEEGEDAIEACRQLHIKAEQLIEDQCDELMAFVAVRMKKRKPIQHPKPEKKPEPAAV